MTERDSMPQGGLPMPQPVDPAAAVLAQEQAYWTQLFAMPDTHVWYDAVEYALILDLLGGSALGGLRVLDLGCGYGLWTHNLAERGAVVFPTDLAQPIVAAAQRAAEPQPAHGFAADMHMLPVASGAFDRVFGSMVVHHAQDHAVLGREVARVLRPGGVAVFHENSARNPLFMWARRNLVGRFGIPRNSSPGEHPLRTADIAAFARAFRSVDVLVGRNYIAQLAVKYLLRRESGPLFDAARRLDDRLYTLAPQSRAWSYLQIVVARK